MSSNLLWIILAWLAGTLPFAVWIGRLLLHTDIRQFGDGNPGATNVLRAGGKGAAALALLVDFAKGALPVGLARWSGGLDGWPLIAVALAPILGHAFSPWLAGRGGKAVATTGGVWCGLTLWEGPTVAGLLLGVGYLLLTVDGWAVVAALSGLLLYLLLTPVAWNGLLARPATWIILAVWIGNLGIVAYKHRADLAKPWTWRASTPRARSQ